MTSTSWTHGCSKWPHSCTIHALLHCLARLAGLLFWSWFCRPCGVMCGWDDGAHGGRWMGGVGLMFAPVLVGRPLGPSGDVRPFGGGASPGALRSCLGPWLAPLGLMAAPGGPVGRCGPPPASCPPPPPTPPHPYTCKP